MCGSVGHWIFSAVVKLLSGTCTLFSTLHHINARRDISPTERVTYIESYNDTVYYRDIFTCEQLLSYFFESPKILFMIYITTSGWYMVRPVPTNRTNQTPRAAFIYNTSAGDIIGGTHPFMCCDTLEEAIDLASRNICQEKLFL